MSSTGYFTIVLCDNSLIIEKYENPISKIYSCWFRAKNKFSITMVEYFNHRLWRHSKEVLSWSMVIVTPSKGTFYYIFIRKLFRKAQKFQPHILKLSVLRAFLFIIFPKSYESFGICVSGWLLFYPFKSLIHCFGFEKVFHKIQNSWGISHLGNLDYLISKLCKT